jgi:hypothetical protein
MFWQIMLFYALLTFLIMPLIFQRINGPAGLGQGYVAGSILSLILWFSVGKKLSMGL